MADVALWNAGDRPRVWLNWETFRDQGIPESWRLPVQEAVLNAYTRWQMSAGVDCRFQFYGYTTRTDPSDGEIIVRMNERHFDSTRIASLFGGWRKGSLVVHRKNGSNLTNWNLVPWNAEPGQIDLQGVLTHEFGHCYWLDHSSSGTETMQGGYNYHNTRYGPWEGDVARVKAIFRDFDRNRLRRLASTDGGGTWHQVPTEITSYEHYQARTCTTPGVVEAGTSGILNLAWSHPSRVPTWLRNDGADFLFREWRFYGGERAVHGNTLASAPDGTMLWTWVDNDDDGTVRIVRSRNAGGSWSWAGSPAGARSGAQPGIAVTTVGGVRTWVLVWSHFDRGDHDATGSLRASVSTNDGATWSTPVVLNSFYKSQSGVSVAAAEDNRVMVGFAWAPQSTYGTNYLRTLNCRVDGGALDQVSVGYTGDLSRTQPALAFDRTRNRFVMAFREQNFLTSIRTSVRSWSSSTWPAAVQVPGTSAATPPGLAVDHAGHLHLWYGGE